MSVAAAAVGRDHEALGLGVTLLSHRPPPSADRIDREAGGVVVRADADPADIVGDVVDAVRHGAAQLAIDEIMNIDAFRCSFGLPFPAVVLEIAHQFLLFRIHRNDGFVRRQERRGLRVDVLKLRVAIDVLAAFSCLVVRLQAVAHAAQKVADNRRANLMTLLRQLGHEVTQAAGCPQQRLRRIAPRRGLDKALEIDRKSGILGYQFFFTSSALIADTAGWSRNIVANIGKSVINRRPRQSADAGHQTDPAVSQRTCFKCNKAPTALFVQNRGHLPIALPCLTHLTSPNHATTLRPVIPPCESRLEIIL